MKIQQLCVIQDRDFKNILIKDFSEDYEGADKLDRPDKIVQVMNDVFGLADKAEEYLYLICMTSYCRPIGFFEVAHGTHDTAIVGLREIFVRALLCGATDIVIVHNHPGGLPQPTEEDLWVTKRIQVAAELIGIKFCDHIIVSRGEYFSFSENGEMDRGVIGKRPLSEFKKQKM